MTLKSYVHLPKWLIVVLVILQCGGVLRSSTKHSAVKNCVGEVSIYSRPIRRSPFSYWLMLADTCALR